MRKPLKHSRRNLFNSADRVFEGAAVASVSSAWMADELADSKELEYLDYEKDISSRYEELVHSQELDGDISMGTARSQGVENEWEMYSFFAQDDVNAPDKVFKYMEDDGSAAYFNEQQQQQIREWHAGDPYPVSDIEGHHVETIKENPNNQQLAADSDNILFATEDAHLNHLHGGNTQNPTAEAYTQADIPNDDKLAMTLEHNEELITHDFWESMGITSGISAGIYVTASMVIELIKLKKDTRPWVEKKKGLAVHALVAGVAGGSIGAASYMAYAGIDNLVGDFSVHGLETFFGEMLAVNGAYFAVSLTMAGYTYIKMRLQRKTNAEALSRFKSMAVTAVAELAVFSTLGIGIEIGMDMLGDLAVDVLIPDPTGILIAARLSYSLLKMSKKYLDVKKVKTAYEQCTEIRRDYLYDRALAYLPEP